MTRSDNSESSVSPTSSDGFEQLSNHAMHPTQPQHSDQTSRLQTTFIGEKPTTTKTHTGVYYLPVPGSKNAPKKFKGKYSEIKHFINHYEKLCVQKQVTDPKEKVDNITQYCSKNVREFMEGLPNYVRGNWEAFVQDLLEFYDADRDVKRYKRGDLEALCKNMRHWKTGMRLSHWKQFNRDFIRIASWLETHQKISIEETAVYYWKGIPQDFRTKLEARLLAINPDHDLELPFNIDQVNKVAKSFLQRNRFDSDRIYSDNDSDDSDSEYSGDESDSEDDSDSELKSTMLKLRKKREERKKTKVKPKKTVEFKEPPEEIIKPTSKPKSMSKTKSDEVEDLIQQMNRMSINDPTYSVLYYRAYNLDPVIGDIMMKPIVRQQLSRQIVNNRVNELRTNAAIAQNNVLSQNPPPSVNRDIPPHLSPGANVFQQNGPPRSDERRCFGCGKVGHTIYMCAEIETLLTQGVISRGPTGRIVMGDGSPIRKLAYDEPLIPAIDRQRPAQANFVTVKEIGPRFVDESDEDSDDEDVFIATRSMKRNAKPATDKTRSQYRRFDGPRTRIPGKENLPLPLEPRIENIPVPQTPTPLSIDNAIFEGNNDDELMDDTPSHSQKTIESRAVIPKRPPRKSEVQSQVDQMTILGRILNQPVTLAVGEVFGISKEMTASLKEVLKTKASSAPIEESSQVHTTQVTKPTKEKTALTATATTRARELLIKLRMECEGKPITAIIDTGSQLNIAHTDIWKSILQRPIDTQSTVIMNDAGGGETKLSGLVANVPLSCGSVMTHANVYIGDNVQFDLLLGRPWQRGNFVSIDEREDGTYLLFKDRNLDVRHEVLVTPEDIVVQDPYSHDYYRHPKKHNAFVNSIFVDEQSNDNAMDVDEPRKTMEAAGTIDGLGGETSKRFEKAEEDKEPPGLTRPKDESEVRKFSKLWSKPAAQEETRQDQSIVEVKRAENWPLDEDDWQLTQVLTKQNTKDWRKLHVRLKERIPQVLKKKSKQLSKGVNTLKKLALEKATIKRLWNLTRHLSTTTTNIAELGTNEVQEETYRHPEAFSSHAGESMRPEEEKAEEDDGRDQATNTAESETTLLRPKDSETEDREKTVETETRRIVPATQEQEHTNDISNTAAEIIFTNNVAEDIQSMTRNPGARDAAVGNPGRGSADNETVIPASEQLRPNRETRNAQPSTQRDDDDPYTPFDPF